MKKGTATRQRIIDQAAPLFNQRGFDGTSINDIMHATGLEKGGIYRHFPTKQHLAVETVRHSIRTVAAARFREPSPARDSISTLRYLVHQFTDVPSPIPGGCPLMNTAIDSDDGNPELRALAARAIRAWKKQLATLVRRGIAEGHIRPSTQPSSIANLIIATLEGALMISRIERDRAALADATQALDAMLDAIATPTRPPLERFSTST